MVVLLHTGLLQNLQISDFPGNLVENHEEFLSKQGQFWQATVSVQLDNASISIFFLRDIQCCLLQGNHQLLRNKLLLGVAGDSILCTCTVPNSRAFSGDFLAAVSTNACRIYSQLSNFVVILVLRLENLLNTQRK